MQIDFVRSHTLLTIGFGVCLCFDCLTVTAVRFAAAKRRSAACARHGSARLGAWHCRVGSTLAKGREGSRPHALRQPARALLSTLYLSHVVLARFAALTITIHSAMSTVRKDCRVVRRFGKFASYLPVAEADS